MKDSTSWLAWDGVKGLIAGGRCAQTTKDLGGRVAIGDGVCVAGRSVEVGVGGSVVDVAVSVGTGVGGIDVVVGETVVSACPHPLSSSAITVRVKK